MVNPGHLEKLQENVDDWNTWRHDNPSIASALWGADLESADLRVADLERADLEEADLSGADLRGADLRGAKLKNADLSGTNLWSANFGNADLKRTDLEGANLLGARNLRTKQICEAKTLYQAELDPDLERKTRYECPLLFEKPREKTYR